MPRPFGSKDFARMPTVRIVKYTPAVVMGLLVVAWVFTQGGWMQFCSGKFVVALQHGSITGFWQESDRITFFWEFRKEQWFRGAPKLGQLKTADPRGSTGSWFPLPLLCTIILPFAIGPFISYRFRLWHYFAYTALVAALLAYYLPWQREVHRQMPRLRKMGIQTAPLLPRPSAETYFASTACTTCCAGMAADHKMWDGCCHAKLPQYIATQLTRHISPAGVRLQGIAEEIRMSFRMPA